MKKNVLFIVGFFLTIFVNSVAADSDIRVIDDAQRTVVLKSAATRIVALAPHIVENVFSAGAGDLIVGTVESADYPDQAKLIPRVGAISTFSIESIAAVKPDLIIVWRSGLATQAVTQLSSLGFTVYADDPRTLSDVRRSIQNFGVLTGRSEFAQREIEKFTAQIDSVRAANKERLPVSVLYQIWHEPLQSLNGEHIVSEIISLCGGVNVFASAATLAPVFNVESVIDADPDVIVASGIGNERPPWLDDWNKWPMLSAVKKSNLYAIPPDFIQRPTLRLALGITEMCAAIDKARR